MKKCLFLSILLMAGSSFAAQSLSTKLEQKPDSKITKGLRVSLSKPSFRRNLEGSANGQESSTGNESAGNTYGLNIGYANLPVKSIGWTSNFGFMNFSDIQGIKAKLLRVDGNVGYAFNRYLHIKGGLNISKFIDGDVYQKLDPGFGIQLGGGVMFTKNIGFDLMFVQLNQSGNIQGSDFVDANLITAGNAPSKIDTDVRVQGVELALTGTF